MQDSTAECIAAPMRARPIVPRPFVVGIGAEKGVPAADFEAAVCDVLQAFGLAPGSVRAVATLDRRAAEEGFGVWATQRGWPVLAYTAQQLASLQGTPNPYTIADQTVNPTGVCEPAAMLASGSRTLLVSKQKRGRVTVAVAQCTDDSPTLAASSAPPGKEQGYQQVSGELASLHPTPILTQGGAHLGQSHLTVLGLDPGAAEPLTERGVKAIEAAEVLVGYSGYLQLLGDRVAEKELHGNSSGREGDCIRLALDLAHHGRRVALIARGNAGIYGMARQILEVFHAQGTTCKPALEVEVIPGATVAEAAASLIGAPVNDFTVLSLSDLFRAWEKSERRLEELAAADVVLGFYNLQRQSRPERFLRVLETLLRHRPARTPVAVVEAANHEAYSGQGRDLGHLTDLAVDIDSLVLIGNCQAGVSGGHTVTGHGQGKLAAAGLGSGGPFEETSSPDTSAQQPSRKVLFIGAGPGDAELLTLKGAKALTSADVVVYAGSLVPRGVLQHVRRGARIYNSATLTLEETHRLLTEAYRAGEQIVRLHSGDPSLYGAITEQMALLDEEQIPYEIVPGISSFQAVAARLGIEYTQPGVVQTLILTRPGGRTGMPENESLIALARHGVTLCVFLGASHVVAIQEALLTSYPPTTPVAVAYRATWPDEELTVGTLADLVQMVQGPEYDRTTLIIVGPSLQRQGKRSHLYDPSYEHRFRPGKRRGGGMAPELPE
jgi:precorrin-4/cobalt-precorrin-4 C11-methyltransferase